MSYPDLCQDRHEHHNFPDPPQLHWSILRVGSEVIDPKHDGADPGHGWWSFYLPEKPGLCLVQEGGVFEMPLDRITFIPPWMPFRYSFPADMGHAYIHFSVQHLPGAMLRKILPTPRSLDDDSLCERMRSLATAIGFDRIDATDAALAAGEIVALALPQVVRTLDATDRGLLFSNNDQWGRLDAALRYIRRNMHQQIAVSDLAAELEVGEKQCTRLFRRHLGQSPVQFLTEQRVQRATELLMSTDWGLDRIALYCGFPNAQYLSRQFRRQHGMPPGRWRLHYGH